MLPTRLGLGLGDRRMAQREDWGYPPPPQQHGRPQYYDDHQEPQRRGPVVMMRGREAMLPPPPPAPIHGHLGAAAAPLPPLRATLYREDGGHGDDWHAQSGMPRNAMPGARQLSLAVPHGAMHPPRMELFAHLSPPGPPLRRQRRGYSNHDMYEDEEDGVEEDDDDGEEQEQEEEENYGRHHPHHQQYQQQQQRHSGGGSPQPTAAHTGGEVGSSGNSSRAATSGSSSSNSKKRSRRMSNSERGKLYRSRRKEYVDTLEDQVEDLKRELHKLRMSNGNGSANTNANASGSRPQQQLALANASFHPRDLSRAGLARTVCEYFQLFQFGVPVDATASSASGACHLTSHRPPSAMATVAQGKGTNQVAVLQALVDPNMRFGEQFGIDMLLKQWERYSTYHSSLQFDLNTLELVMGDGSSNDNEANDDNEEDNMPFISATATLKVRFSRLTIEKVFPHVLWNEPLVQKLIGRDVTYAVANKFYFGQDGKIARYETEVDFVSAFIQALGNVRDAMVLVGNALIKEQSLIGAEDEDEGAQDLQNLQDPGQVQDPSDQEQQVRAGSATSTPTSVASSPPELAAAAMPSRYASKQVHVQQLPRHGDLPLKGDERRRPSSGGGGPSEVEVGQNHPYYGSTGGSYGGSHVRHQYAPPPPRQQQQQLSQQQRFTEYSDQHKLYNHHDLHDHPHEHERDTRYVREMPVEHHHRHGRTSLSSPPGDEMFV